MPPINTMPSEFTALHAVRIWSFSIFRLFVCGYAVWILHRNATHRCQDWKPFLERWRIKEYAFNIYPLQLKWDLGRPSFFSNACLRFLNKKNKRSTTITQANTCQKSHSTQMLFFPGHGRRFWQGLLGKSVFGMTKLPLQCVFSTTLYMLCTKFG